MSENRRATDDGVWRKCGARPERIEAYKHQCRGDSAAVLIAMACVQSEIAVARQPRPQLPPPRSRRHHELIKDISANRTSMIYISHNLGLILETCHKLTVMYSGQAVETGSVKQVFDMMRHPYTRGLFNSIPLPGTDRFARPLVPIRGQLPLPAERPPGCSFAPRCDYFQIGVATRQSRCLSGADPARARCFRYRIYRWTFFRRDAACCAGLTMAIGDRFLEVKRMKTLQIREIRSRMIHA